MTKVCAAALALAMALTTSPAGSAGGVPRAWSDQQLFPAGRIPAGALSPTRAVVRRKIVLYHNFLRAKVRPPAANMLLMSWHGGAAAAAQRHAERCEFLRHDEPSERRVPLLGVCGQNLFAAKQRTPWFFALKSWFVEFRNFTYGAPVRDLPSVGHYTQMVWASSHRVGCGLAQCAGGPWGAFYNYVCHYCPRGNVAGAEGWPYEAGAGCSRCGGAGASRWCAGRVLCRNACPRVDEFSNCHELQRAAPRAVCRTTHCNATCLCGTERIHGHHPWH